jgi:hypothetical protein
MLVGTVAVRWLIYRHLLHATLRQALGGALAYLALTHVITVASLTALAGRDVPWRRTDRSRPLSQGWAALHACEPNLFSGVMVRRFSWRVADGFVVARVARLVSVAAGPWRSPRGSGGRSPATRRAVRR